MNKLLSFILLFSISQIGNCGITEEGSGIIYGDNHVYTLQAPVGWVLDNESAVHQKLYAVFYPVGSTWANSRVVAYSKGITKDEVIKDIPSYVKFTIDGFIEKGSPNYLGKFIKTLDLKNKQEASIYHYQGDQWGNFEAVGYVEEEKTINIVVLNCKTKIEFENSLGAFESLVSSYVFLADHVTIKKASNKAN